jgi:type IV fimbrial biogenesis protein FimT
MGLRQQSGFTLIELMTTVVIVAILLGIGLPSFQGVMRSNRIATTTNEMVASLSLARNEAIKNAHGAGVCASTAGTACDGASWGDGWLVWSDLDADGALGADETVLRFSAGKSGITGDAQDLSILYDSRGRRVAAGDQSVVLQPDECGSQALQRTLSINRTGQVKVAKGSCS